MSTVEIGSRWKHPTMGVCVVTSYEPERGNGGRMTMTWVEGRYANDDWRHDGTTCEWIKGCTRIDAPAPPAEEGVKFEVGKWYRLNSVGSDWYDGAGCLIGRSAKVTRFGAYVDGVATLVELDFGDDCIRRWDIREVAPHFTGPVPAPDAPAASDVVPRCGVCGSNGAMSRAGGGGPWQCFRCERPKYIIGADFGAKDETAIVVVPVPTPPRCAPGCTPARPCMTKDVCPGWREERVAERQRDDGAHAPLQAAIRAYREADTLEARDWRARSVHESMRTGVGGVACRMAGVSGRRAR